MSSTARPDAGPGLRIGTIAGTPVFLGRSWPLIVLLVLLVVVPSQGNAGGSLGQSLVIAVVFAVMLLVSVLVHEAAHALVALWRGHRVDRIVADVWGGHTVYDATAGTPVSTALVAVAGPLSNLALAGVSWLAQPHVGGGMVHGVLDAVTYTNLFVGLYNLLPGLPLDGGQIVSSLVWRATGRKGTGLTAAGWLGRVVAVGSVLWFVGLPLLRGQTPTPIALVWTAMIGFFLWRGASAAIRSGQIHDATAGPAAEVLDPVVLVPGETSLGEVDRGLAAQTAGAAAPWVVAADPAGWPLGLLDAESATRVPAEARDRTPVSSVVLAQPVSWVVSLAAEAVLTDLIRVMSSRDLSFAVVVDEATREVRGLASAERINTVVGAELARRGRR
jgi:Zn-dependent protease